MSYYLTNEELQQAARSLQVFSNISGMPLRDVCYAINLQAPKSRVLETSAVNDICKEALKMPNAPLITLE